ncbi:hypothetical protein LPJ66_003038 [Kickxella alabastrina]|uniref:Uncharacterized protein n=1 Tax=Kickxella alabastrina TaxID=61397 RepID=A0ACC1INN2_9FUNG|nr:hypothetical protein LPJ66_003038 [Kickxella alabastrina]
MDSLASIDTTMPVQTPDSPISEHLSKRGHINISPSDQPALNLYYEIYGTGQEKIVFINGMGADRQMWEPNVAEFLKLSNYQCLVYDHRGTGFSDIGSSGPLSFTSSVMARDLKCLMDVLGWNTRVNVVGASMGGMVALEFATGYAHRVKTLSLVVTNAGLSLPPLKGIVDTVGANFVRDPIARFKAICGSLYSKEYLESPAPEGSGCKNMLEYCAQNAVRKSRNSRPMSFWSFLGQVGMVFRHYVSPARLRLLGRLLPDKQILIVTGDEDHMVRTSNSVYLADTIGREHVIFEVYHGAAHGLCSQEAAKLVRHIDKMITDTNK